MKMRDKRPHGSEAVGGGDLGKIDAGDPIGDCPSCDAPISVGNTKHPHTGKPTRMLLHPMPFCTYFGETDPDVIEEAIYKRRGLIP